MNHTPEGRGVNSELDVAFFLLFFRRFGGLVTHGLNAFLVARRLEVRAIPEELCPVHPIGKAQPRATTKAMGIVYAMKN